MLTRHKNDIEVSDLNLLIQCEFGKYSEIRLTYRLRKESLTEKKFAKQVKTFDSKERFITYLRAEVDRWYRKKEIEHKIYQNAKAVYFNKQEVQQSPEGQDLSDINSKFIAFNATRPGSHAFGIPN